MVSGNEASVLTHRGTKLLPLPLLAKKHKLTFASFSEIFPRLLLIRFLFVSTQDALVAIVSMFLTDLPHRVFAAQPLTPSDFLPLTKLWTLSRTLALTSVVHSFTALFIVVFFSALSSFSICTMCAMSVLCFFEP